MRISLLALVTTLALLGGCGESTEHKLQQAGIAMSAGNVDVALDLADQVLAVEPTNTTAQMIKARSHLRLRQYDVAEKLFLKLVEKPELALDGRRELMLLALGRMTESLNHSEFVESSSLQEIFTAAKSLGHDQADWLIEIGQQLAEGEYFRARLILLDAGRMDREIKAEGTRTKGATDDETAQPNRAAVEDKKLQIERMRLDAVRRLNVVLENQPNHHLAAQLLLTTHSESRSWEGIWQLARLLQGQSELPAKLAVDIASLLVQMPEEVQKRKPRLALAVALMSGVSAEDQKSGQWKSSRAMLHLHLQEVEQGYSLAMEAFRLQPNDERVKLALGWALFEQQRYDQAKAVLADVAASRPDSEHIQMMYGLTMAKLGDRALAEEALRRVTKINENNAAARAALIELISSEKRSLVLVIDDINKLYQKTPADPQAIRFKLMADMSRGDRVAVQNLVKATRALSPLTAEHMRILVEGNLYLRDHAEALRFAEEAAKAEPQSPQAAILLARVHLLQNNPGAARQVLVGLQKQGTSHVEVNMALAQLYLDQGLFDQAVELAQAVLKDKPDDRSAKLIVAKGLVQLSMIEEAQELVTQLLDADASYAPALELAAMIHHTLDQPDQARLYWERIDENAMDEMTNPAMLARLKMYKGQTAEALDVCQRAIARGQTNAEIRLMVAAIHGRNKNLSEQEAHLVALVRDQPNSYHAFRLLARFYRDSNPERGIGEFRTLRSVNEALARFSEAYLLSAKGSGAQAYEVLSEMLGRLIVRKDPLALSYIRAIAQMRGGTQVDETLKLYQSLIDAGVAVPTATLAQIDLTWKKPDEAATLKRLESLAGQLLPADRQAMGGVAARLQSLGQIDRAIHWVDAWLKREPGDQQLMVFKGDYLVRAGQYAEAITVFRKALETAIDPIGIHERIARTQWAVGDHPGAVVTLDAMAKVSTVARIRATRAKAELFIRLGLAAPATAALATLDDGSRTGDPRVCFTLGRGYMALGKLTEAQSFLVRIPRTSEEYLTAQILLSRIEEMQGKLEDARMRLERTAVDRTAGEYVARELISMGMKHRDQDRIMKWCDRAISLESLPAKVKVQWLALRLAVQQRERDWAGMDASIKRTIQLAPSPRLEAAYAAFKAVQKKADEARSSLGASQPVARSEEGVLVALGLDVVLPSDAAMSPLTRWLRACLAKDVSGARKAAGQFVEFNQLIYRADLESYLETLEASPSDAEALKQCALALAAMGGGLFAAADQAAEEAIRIAPKLPLGHAIRLAALNSLAKPLDAAQKSALEHVPQTVLGAYVASAVKASAKDYKAACVEAEKVVAKAPGHEAALFRLAQLHASSGDLSKTVDLLRRVIQLNGRMTPAAKNDLAFFLAEQEKPSLDEAMALAKEASALMPGSASVMDTLGWIEHLRGNHAAGLSMLSRAIQDESLEPGAHFRLGSVYKELGNETWARYHLAVAAASPDAKLAAKAKGLLSALDLR